MCQNSAAKNMRNLIGCIYAIIFPLLVSKCVVILNANQWKMGHHLPRTLCLSKMASRFLIKRSFILNGSFGIFIVQ